MAVEKVWTGHRIIILDNVCEIEVKMPGELLKPRWSSDYMKQVDFYNESTTVFVYFVNSDENYEPLELQDVESRLLLDGMGMAFLYKRDASVNDESRKKMEIVEAAIKVRDSNETIAKIREDIHEEGE